MKLTNVTKIYQNQGTNPVTAINQINLKLEDKGLIFVIGKSGSGKTTLLNLLMGLDAPTEGTVDFLGSNDIESFDFNSYRTLKIGFIAQDYQLFDRLSVFDNLMLPLKICDIHTSADERIKEVLEYVDLMQELHHRVNELSGGQKQRVAIARALLRDPDIILADEPTGNLDEQNSIRILQLLKHISSNKLVVVVSHDLELANMFADRIIELKDGLIIEDNDKRETTHHHSNELWSCMINDEKYYYYDRLELYQHLTSFLENDEEMDYLEIRKLTNGTHQEKMSNAFITPVHNKTRLRFKWWDAFLFSMKSMSHRKIRFIVTILLFALSSMLFYFTLSLVNYNQGNIIYHYLKRYNIKEFPVYQNVEYRDEFLQINQKQLHSGQEIYQRLMDLFDEENIIKNYKKPIKYTENPFNGYYRVYQEEIVINTIDTLKNIHSENIIGKIPRHEFEILLTDYIMNQLSISIPDGIGEEVLIDETPYTISGVLLTDYSDYQLMHKLSDYRYSRYANYHLQTKYSVGYVGEYFQNENVIDLKTSDFSRQRRFAIEDYGVTYGPLRLIDDTTTLMWGRLPENPNEVLISADYFYNAFSDSEKDIEAIFANPFHFKDIYDEKYNIYFSDRINLFDYFPNGIKVVGIFTGENLVNLYDSSYVIINDEVFDDIQKRYTQFYNYDSLTIRKDSPFTKEEIDGLIKAGISINEPNISYIQHVKMFAERFVPIFWGILIILVLIIGFLIISLIGFSIQDNKKQIGILRTLGFTNGDTIKIFLVEVFMLMVATLLTTVVLIIIVNSVINHGFKQSIYEQPYNILRFDALSMLVVSVSLVILSLICSMLPIYRISKERIVNLFK